MAHDPQQG